MTDVAKLIERLRDTALKLKGNATGWRYASVAVKEMREAADALEQLQAERDSWNNIALVQDEKAHHWLERMRPLETEREALKQQLLALEKERETEREAYRFLVTPHE